METLRSRRLQLRGFEASDFGWLHPITAHPAVTRYTDWGPNEPADTRAFLDDAARSGVGPTELLWAITLEDGTGIGSAGIEVTSEHHRRASFGYTISPDHWSRGYATEAAKTLIAFAVSTLGMHRVEATCHPDNKASVRVLEKVGLTLEGRLRDHFVVRGEWRDSPLYAFVAPRP